ncbi:hypothetical protein ACFCXA_20385 [Streptomyces virginiae]|uniref:hypothetical protein n=1 Tax=Streptomyces virginiae TaxID=1961 RepID=UPI0035E205E3
MPEAPAGSGPRRRAVLATALAPLAGTGCSGDGAGGSGKVGEAARPPAPGAPAGPEDALVMVIRHAERPYAGGVGRDEEGEDDPGSLTGRGRRRAERLPRLFPPAPGSSLPRPATIFAAGGGKGTAAPARSRQTVTPLATALRTPVRAEFAVGGEAALARAALAAPMPVLVCWEHSGIPRLIQALGADRVPGTPSTWPDRYDLVWMFTLRQGRWSFRELPQHLLPGDV